jgi:hypothetical protein
LVENANFVAEQTGWKMKNHVMDMRSLSFESKFDHITSICVHEHIPVWDRVVVSRRIKDLLFDGGKFNITFDYRNPSRDCSISSQDIYEQFVKLCGLKVRGNVNFFDNDKNYLLGSILS